MKVFLSTAAQCTAGYMSSGAQENVHLQPSMVNFVRGLL